MKLKQKVDDLSPQMLLTFLDDDEQSDLLNALSLQTLEDIKNFSTSHVLLTIANLRSPFILMMRDISEIVSAVEAFIHGNIQVIVLPDQGHEMRIDFGPQLRAFIVEALDNKLLSDHSDIVSTRLQECENELHRLFRSLQPRRVDRTASTGKSLRKIAEQLGPTHPRSFGYRFAADRVFTHQQMEHNPLDAQGIRELYEKIANVHTLASKTDGETRSNDQTEIIIQAIKQLEIITAKKVREVLAKVSREYPAAPRSVTESDFHRCQQKVDAVNEAIIALSRQKEALDDILDFMKLEVWRQRWRIYELWLLSRAVLFLIKLGGRLKPLQRVSNGSWALKFTKDEEPAAQLTLAGIDINVYYQLYRAASYGGDMPDIAVEVSGQGFILVLDPKHGRSYSRSDLKAVCTRYSESFEPLLSCVANYFPHEKPIEYVDDDATRLLIYDVAPGTTSLVALEEAYAQAVRSAWRKWAFPINSVIILFDVSGSTSDVRAKMIADLKKRFNPLSTSEQSVLLPFSTKPTDVMPIIQLWESDFRLPIPSGGTDFNSAFESAFALAGRMHGACEIWLYSDGDGLINWKALEAGLTQSKVNLNILDFAQDADKSALSALREIPCVSYEYCGNST